MSAAAYAAAATLAAPVLRVLLARRAVRGREVASRLAERRGFAGQPRPPGRLLWLHAASVGETVSVLPVVAGLPAEIEVLFTSGTVTSAELLARRLPELGVERRVRHRFVPLDVPRWAARFLDHWRPDAAAFVESEIWPNLLTACDMRGIRRMLVNGRMSARSFANWRRVPGFARTLFGGFARVQAQSAADAGRLAALGARDVESPGNLKFAAPPLPVPQEALPALRAVLAGRPVWLAASTHPGEEDIVAAAHRALAPAHPGLLTIIVPRHPDRGAEIAAAITDTHVRRRALDEGPPEGAGIWVADTLGELGLFYAATGLAFVGGSLVPHGGQNVLEAARLGCAVAVGPHTANFAEPVAALAKAGALARVGGADPLAAWVAAMLADPARRDAAGTAGRGAASHDADLPARVAAALCSLLPA
jgi:3-deoxy-D-manno-octulosonic-acid transferase